MDLITTRTRGNPSLPTKSHESDTDTETPLQTHLSKALSLTNGSLVRHQRAHTPSPPPTEPLQQQMVVSYKECLKNHAASLGGVALDGCGEFMPAPTATLLDPTSLKCAACGCHRNFHRRDQQPHHPPLPAALHWISSPSPSSGRSPSPSSPASPTPQQSVYPSAPHMLLALSTAGQSGLSEENFHHRHYHQNPSLNPMVMDPHGKKRARTKFTEEQREKMQSFAEKLGWKMLRGNDEKTVDNFCNEVGVKRNVFKVWMHNNKHRRVKGNVHLDTINVNGNEERVGFVSYNINENTNSSSNHNYDDNLDKYKIIKSEVHVHGSTTTDGSSPSSS